jgi:hypothetical protein
MTAYKRGSKRARRLNTRQALFDQHCQGISKHSKQTGAKFSRKGRQLHMRHAEMIEEQEKQQAEDKQQPMKSVSRRCQQKKSKPLEYEKPLLRRFWGS